MSARVWSAYSNGETSLRTSGQSLLEAIPWKHNWRIKCREAITATRWNRKKNSGAMSWRDGGIVTSRFDIDFRWLASDLPDERERSTLGEITITAESRRRRCSVRSWAGLNRPG